MSEFTPLIRFSREQDAQLLAAYLRNQAIDCIVTPVEVQEQVPPQAQRTDTRNAFQLYKYNTLQNWLKIINGGVCLALIFYIFRRPTLSSILCGGGFLEAS